MVWYINICGGLRSNRVGQNRETYEEHDGDCVEEGFQLARVKFGRDGETGWRALDMENCSSNTWDASELELAWPKKNSSYFENNFLIFLLSDIFNTSIFKVMFYIE